MNTDAFRQDILSSELLSTNSSDLNSLCSRYDDVISAIVDKNARLVTKTITVRPNPPWYTDDIGVEKSTRRRFERRWRRTLLPEHRLAYVAQCKLVKSLVLNAKTKYYSNLISESSSNSKALFSSKQLTNYFIENLKLVYLMLLRHSILQTNLETFFI